MEELRLNDPDHNPKSSELVNHRSIQRLIAMKREPSPAKIEIAQSIESQPKIQLNRRSGHSEESISIEEKEIE